MVQGLCLVLTRSGRQAAGQLRLSVTIRASSTQIRSIHQDGRARLSHMWVPTGGISATENEDAHAKLIRAGFIRQSHSGLFQMLPFGLRVQEKIEKLIDGHMQGLGASKLALSTISSQALWEKSGRLENGIAELFRFEDRRETPLLLSPTHEEEITSLVAKTIKSYKELPLRLYQITRKYRDEFRPRHGLLRGREFTMKDLYTFDPTVQEALATYEEVRQAYVNFFADLKLPILVAKASSGDMGGDLSHEYHLPTSLGEDNVVSCNTCDYVVNDELAETKPPSAPSNPQKPEIARQQLSLWQGITKDKKRIVKVWYLDPSKTDPTAPPAEVSIHAIKQLVPELDTSVQDVTPFLPNGGEDNSLSGTIELFDRRIKLHTQPGEAEQWLDAFETISPFYPHRPTNSLPHTHDRQEYNLLKIRTGDECPRCKHGTLQVQKAIELGHTFHLGTRYSQPLEATIQLASGGAPVPLQMGCHGIGVSRLIGVVANHLSDEKGLNWPRRIAPFECVVIGKEDVRKDAEGVFDDIVGPHKGVDAVLDDRWNARFPWRMKDAELIGYPVVVILGKEWKEGRAEVQCRRLGVRRMVEGREVGGMVRELLEEL